MYDRKSQSFSDPGHPFGGTGGIFGHQQNGLMPHTTMINAAITAIGGYVPETKLTNFDLEKLVDTNDEWITSRTGIKERRILREPGKATSDMAVEAVNELLRKRGISADEIDLLIMATITGDLVFPSCAN